MTLEKNILKVVKGIRTFGTLSIGAMIALLLEYGVLTEIIVCLVLALFLCFCTTLKIKEDEEMIRFLEGKER